MAEVGFGAGGFAQGLDEARAGRRADRALDIQQANVIGSLGLRQSELSQGQTESNLERLNTQIKSTFDLAKTAMDNHIEGGGAPTDPRIQQLVTSLRDDAVELANSGVAAGLPVNSAFVERRFDSLFTQPTRAQLTEQKAIEAGATRRAEEEAAAQVAVSPATAELKTDVGQLGQDLAATVERFGENSPQARAVREQLEAKSQGEVPDIKDVAGLRKEFTALSKDFNTVADAFGKIKASATDPSAAGDLAMIFNFMKLLDPGSVVREGEFATAQEAAGVPARIRSLYNRVVSGERLVPEQRQDFLNQADKIMSSQVERQKLRENQFGELAERQNFPRENVVVDFLGPLRDLEVGEDQETPPEVKEGTIIENNKGERMIFRNGKWQDL